MLVKTALHSRKTKITRKFHFVVLTQKVAKAQAEKRYREILQSSGISDDLVDVKSTNKSANDSYSREFITLDEDNDSDDDVDSLPLDQSTDIPSR